jgi:hypothetical protein
MFRSLAVIAALVMFGFMAGAAQASPWPFKDPRVCGGSLALPAAQCVAGAAKIAVIRAYGTFLSFECEPTAPLRATCPTNKGTYAVVFSRSKGRWWVKVTP